MLDHVVHGATAFVRRSAEDGGATQPLGNWIWPLFTLEFVLFFPVLLFVRAPTSPPSLSPRAPKRKAPCLAQANVRQVTYTLSTLYPALAIVEDDHAPPTYQPLAIDTDAEEGGQSRAPATQFPVTASLRRVHALVKSIDGWRSAFRGLAPLLAANFSTAAIRLILSVPLDLVYLGPLASIPAHLALVQLHTVWVHVVITPPSPNPFWKRLPPFSKTFRATVRPIILYALAKEVTRGVPILVFKWLVGDLKVGMFGEGTTNPFVLLAFAPLLIALWFFVELPAQIALMRIQASLLPPDEDPIVPFDRSFGGRVNPLFMVGGIEGEGEKTHATLRDIWETISRAAMWRVARLVLKVTGVHVVVWMVFGAVLGVTSVLAGIPVTVRS